MIKVDYNQAPVFEEFKNGFYEAVVAEVKPTKTKGGKPMLVFNYIVRDDVDQTCKKKHVNFDNFVIQEDNEYFAGFFNQRSIAYGVPNGMNFGSYTEWGQSVVGNPVRLKIEAVQNGQYTNANVVGWSATEHPLGSGSRVDNDPFAPGSGPVNVSDDDLPF